MNTAPIGIARTPPVAIASAEKSAACSSCCGMNCDGEVSAPCPVITHANISARYAPARINSASVCAGRTYENSVAQTAIDSAQSSIRASARRRSPRLRAATMNGKLARVLKTGTASGTPTAHPAAYDATVVRITTSPVTTRTLAALALLAPADGEEQSALMAERAHPAELRQPTLRAP